MPIQCTGSIQRTHYRASRCALASDESLLLAATLQGRHTPMAHRLAILVLGICAAVFAQRSLADQNSPVFETEIQPVLSEKCGKCHSEKVRKGGLDLSSISGLLHGGESDEALIADSIDDSLLWLMVEAGDMPPEGEPQLTEEELALIRRWVEMGVPSHEPSSADGRSDKPTRRAADRSVAMHHLSRPPHSRWWSRSSHVAQPC